jgi:hypothetical protein
LPELQLQLASLFPAAACLNPSQRHIFRTLILQFWRIHVEGEQADEKASALLTDERLKSLQELILQTFHPDSRSRMPPIESIIDTRIEGLLAIVVSTRAKSAGVRAKHYFKKYIARSAVDAGAGLVKSAVVPGL